MWRVCVLLLAAQLSRCRASYSCCSRVPRNTCAVGGALSISSTPAGLPVDATHCDVVYDKEEFQSRPEIKYPDAKSGKTYTLVMVDPDAPNRTLEQYYLHWIRANIRGEDLKVGTLEGSTEITTYLGPAPPVGTGLHRYMFLLFVHFRASSRVAAEVGDPQRQFWTLRTWLGAEAARNNRLCGPVAATQFRAAN